MPDDSRSILGDSTSGLGLDVQRRIDELCDRFEMEWKGGRPLIETYLADWWGAARSAVALTSGASGSPIGVHFILPAAAPPINFQRLGSAGGWRGVTAGGPEPGPTPARSLPRSGRRSARGGALARQGGGGSFRTPMALEGLPRRSIGLVEAELLAGRSGATYPISADHQPEAQPCQIIPAP
jgi:hypothetical protein